MFIFNRERFRVVAVTIAVVIGGMVHVAGAQDGPTLDQRPAGGGEWGYRPDGGAPSAVNPPGFSWRPTRGVVAWTVECARDEAFQDVVHRAEGVTYTVHCPDRSLPAGRLYWRYRGVDGEGHATAWSQVRAFDIAADAVEFPMPGRDALMARVPRGHPRLFLRPDTLPTFRERAAGDLKERFEAMVAYCDRLLEEPPSTEEPPLYPDGMERGTDEWRAIWWGNRTYTIDILRPASELAFTRLMGGKEEYGQLARRLLLECARWDPTGSTGYRYNDEAGMPYNYYFSRTYTFVHDLLTEEERALCRQVMRVRGLEMYNHLHPRHLWQPYGSHQNRAWHFLGEIGLAFFDEIDEAPEWLWFATNVFYNAYPVWSDDDGGWHEGSNYWASYVDRFTWWADTMRETLGLDAFKKPYFSQAGYYAMYLMPPGKTGGGFGDLTASRTARHYAAIMTVLAAQSQNPYWQWYVEQVGGPREASGYVGFVRGALAEITAQAPADLPASRLFEGTGQAYLNRTILGGDDNVQVTFKSSPFGTQSHGYEANNSFLLWAYGERLLIRSGLRDSYGSDHHRNWMWSTRSVNNITVNGHGQGRRTHQAQGRITAFHTSPEVDIVTGEAGGAYVDDDGEAVLDMFERTVVFVKPDLIVIRDRLKAKQPSTYEFWLHAINRFDTPDQRNISTRNGDVVCDIAFLAPEGLTFRQTDQYDPNPRPRVTLREWHLTATTDGEAEETEFLTVYRPRRAGDEPHGAAEWLKTDGGPAVRAPLADGRQAVVLLPRGEGATVGAYGQETTGEVAVFLNGE